MGLVLRISDYWELKKKSAIDTVNSAENAQIILFDGVRYERLEQDKMRITQDKFVQKTR